LLGQGKLDVYNLGFRDRNKITLKSQYFLNPHMIEPQQLTLYGSLFVRDLRRLIACKAERVSLPVFPAVQGGKLEKFT
jgi:hypothetical protein